MAKKRVAAETLSGIISDYFETGFEGVCWVFFADGYDKSADEKTFWDNTFFLEKGDWLKIIAENGTILFEGVINPDRKTGIPKGSRKQPAALGMWIHWTQRGWNPDDWARLFVGGFVTEPTLEECSEHNAKCRGAMAINDLVALNRLSAEWNANHPMKLPLRAEFRPGKENAARVAALTAKSDKNP